MKLGRLSFLLCVVLGCADDDANPLGSQAGMPAGGNGGAPSFVAGNGGQGAGMGNANVGGNNDGDVIVAGSGGSAGAADGRGGNDGSDDSSPVGNTPELEGEMCMGGWADTQRHSAHCGACGSACAPLTIATGLDWPIAIALDETAAYWVTSGNDGQVMSAPLTGGEPIVLARAEPFPMDVEVDATHVYWAAYGSIWRVPLAGGERERLIDPSTQVNAQAIAIDATHVYWVESDDTPTGWVKKAPLEGGEPFTIASLPGIGPLVIALDRTHVYWGNNANGAGSPIMMKAPLEGGEPVTLAMSGLDPYGIAVDATHLYWAGHDTVAAGAFAALESLVQSVPLEGGEVVTLATGTQMPMGIALDSAGAYWTSASTSQAFAGTPGIDGLVQGVALPGGAPVTLAPDQDEPGGIATNGRTLCWTTIGSGQGSGSVRCLSACSEGVCR